MAQALLKGKQKPTQVARAMHFWRKPLRNCVKANCDVALDSNRQEISGDCVIIRSDEMEILAFVKKK